MKKLRMILSGWCVTLVGLALSAAVPPTWPQPSPVAPQEPPAPATQQRPEESAGGSPATATAEAAAAASEEEPEPAFRPRVELYIPSVADLVSAARNSHTAPLARAAFGLFGPGTATDEESVDLSAALALLGRLAAWADTSLVGLIYAPDVEGRPRFGLRLDYELSDLHERLTGLLAEETAQKLLKGARLRPRQEGGYCLELPEIGLELAWLLPAGEGRCCLVSHVDLELPEAVWGMPTSSAPSAAGSSAGQPARRLLYCRYNLAGSEKDSGTIFGGITWVQSINYWCRLDDTGNWEEQFAILWNPLISIGAQQMISPVRGAYYAPGGSLAVAVFGFPVASTLDVMLGLPPGALGASGANETCVSVLPGRGFLPVPDVVLQMRVRNPRRVLDRLVEQARKINRQREAEYQEPLWHEGKLGDQPLLWRQSDVGGGFFAPFVYRPAVFTHKLTDPRGKQRELLILLLTSTTPEQSARTWLTSRKPSEQRVIPTDEELHWQGFIHWKGLYRLAAPWLNLVAAVNPDSRFLPSVAEMSEHLEDSRIDVQRKAAYLLARHRGPLPLGGAYLPAVFALASAPGESGGTDLSRERQAVRNLRVLYHHSKLFRQDYGRWPAELWELDGYVDFAGHPELLRVPESTRGALRSWFEKAFSWVESSEEDEDEKADEDDQEGRPDTSLYVINWSPSDWTLELKPGALDHLQRLWIDQDGKTHRTPKAKQTPASAPMSAEPAGEQADTSQATPHGSE